MTTATAQRAYTADELREILAKHAAWWRSEKDGTRANLSGADLSGADIRDANLRGADLRGAVLDDRTVLDTGETWAVYKAEVLPQLLTAGERGTQAVAGWGKHKWTDCPMAAAFGIHSESEAPALLRPRIRQFVQLFDSHLLDDWITTPACAAIRGETDAAD